MRTVSNISLAIGIPLSFPWVPSSFFHSFVQMDRPTFTYLYADNGQIHEMRNNLVMKALEIGATHLIQMDIDQVYHPQTITRLLSHRLPVVGALVHRRYPPFDSLMLKSVEIDERRNGYESIDEWKDGELVEVDATGGGCLMFEMSVFRKMPRPWFKAQTNPDGSVLGEDIGFCQELKAAGYRIFVDTSVPAGHLTTMIIDRNTSLLYRAMKLSKEKKAAAMGVMENG